MFSGKPEIIKSTEAVSLLNSLSKIQKSELQNLRKKSLEIDKEWEYIVARTVTRLAKSSNESVGGWAKKAAGLHENHTGRATPNGCSPIRERRAVFTAARKCICTKINPLVWYIGLCLICLQDTVYSSRCKVFQKLVFWISRSKLLKNNWIHIKFNYLVVLFRKFDRSIIWQLYRTPFFRTPFLVQHR